MTTLPATIYIIDDDPAIRDSLSLMIEQADFPVRAFESAEAFLGSCKTDAYGCAIIVEKERVIGILTTVDGMRALSLLLAERRREEAPGR